MPQEMKRQFLEIPFGLYSGIASSISSVVFIAIILVGGHFFNLELQFEKAMLGYLAINYFDMKFFFAFIGDALNNISKTKLRIKFSTDKHVIIALVYLIGDAIFDGALIYKACSLEMNLKFILIALLGGRILAGPIIGKILDIISLKNRFFIAHAVSFSVLGAFVCYSQFNLAWSQTFFYKLLIAKGALASGIVLFKSTLALSSNLEKVST